MLPAFSHKPQFLKSKLTQCKKKHLSNVSSGNLTIKRLARDYFDVNSIVKDEPQTEMYTLKAKCSCMLLYHFASYPQLQLNQPCHDTDTWVTTGIHFKVTDESHET